MEKQEETTSLENAFQQCDCDRHVHCLGHERECFAAGYNAAKKEIADIAAVAEVLEDDKQNEENATANLKWLINELLRISAI